VGGATGTGAGTEAIAGGAEVSVAGAAGLEACAGGLVALTCTCLTSGAGSAKKMSASPPAKARAAHAQATTCQRGRKAP